MEILRQRLKQLRENNNMTQDDIGIIIGVKKGAVSYYESGTNMPSFDYLTKLADYFDISLDYFAGREVRAGAVSDIHPEYNLAKQRKIFSLSKEEAKFIKEIRKSSSLHSQLIENPENLVARMKIKL